MDIASEREDGDPSSPLMQQDFKLPNAEIVLTPESDPTDTVGDTFTPVGANLAVDGLMSTTPEREEGDATAPLMQGDYKLPNTDEVLTPVDDPSDTLGDTFAPTTANLAVDGLMVTTPEREEGDSSAPLMQGDYSLPNAEIVMTPEADPTDTVSFVFASLDANFSIKGLMGNAALRADGDATAPLLKQDFKIPALPELLTPIAEPADSVSNAFFALDANFAYDRLMSTTPEREEGDPTAPLMKQDYTLPNVADPNYELTYFVSPVAVEDCDVEANINFAIPTLMKIDTRRLQGFYEPLMRQNFVIPGLMVIQTPDSDAFGGIGGVGNEYKLLGIDCFVLAFDGILLGMPDPD